MYGPCLPYGKCSRLQRRLQAATKVAGCYKGCNIGRKAVTFRLRILSEDRLRTLEKARLRSLEEARLRSLEKVLNSIEVESVSVLSVDLCKHPVDGFSAGLVDESNIFEWSVTIIGPPDTLYEGGFFNAIMTFPQNYPNSPPTVRFTSEVWHPNVYTDGKVCISILHPPGDDPNGYELASERWTPVHTVESIVLSIISMLSSPNDESPANVEAAKEWRERRDDFRKKVGRCVRKSQEFM
ncbi:ubiquitin-conjugating enzyme E2 7 [Tanacetum coccineum]